ncbi:hypothetical protein SAMN06265784_103165 [Paraburkholderia susongensis]|uniref:Uncharacterized protein n=1 Tax=Paraburkholderia susongensis TaxID=1515439 RepID=A0A1X7JYY0_9BURK|nr:hypothetical protein SAMN06265784_103165 [Paraburkholderia susongensis]
MRKRMNPTCASPDGSQQGSRQGSHQDSHEKTRGGSHQRNDVEGMTKELKHE